MAERFRWEVQTTAYRRRCCICCRALVVGLYHRGMQRFLCGDCAGEIAAAAQDLGPALEAAERAVMGSASEVRG